MKVVRFILGAASATGAIFVGVAFAEFSINPGDWPGKMRGVVSLMSIAVGPIVGLVCTMELG